MFRTVGDEVQCLARYEAAETHLANKECIPPRHQEHISNRMILMIVVPYILD